MRNIMFSLNVTCLLLNGFFTYNLTKMVSRASRTNGSTSRVHYFALGFAIVSILLAIGMMIVVYFPMQVQVYRYLQDSYFLI